MSTQTLSLGSKPEIEITNVGGDLTVQGWDRAELETHSDDSPRIKQDGDEVTLSCGSDLNVSMPRGASLTVSYVGGDLKVENLDGKVEVSFIGGDVIFFSCNIFKIAMRSSSDTGWLASSASEVFKPKLKGREDGSRGGIGCPA